MFGKILSSTVNTFAYEFRVYSFLYVIKYIIVNDCFCHLCGVILTLKNSGCDNKSDILTEYPPWSTETYGLYDSDEDIYDRNRKELQNELCKDTPVKTEENKLYTDNIDAYDSDRAQINQSLSDRLGLSQNSLLGAQQVIIATKHNDQMTEV